LPAPYKSYCGDQNTPWPMGDLNRDCQIDFTDIQIFAEEWLNTCDDLNWLCRQADINIDKTANFIDYAAILKDE
jgi:hypothetical protein